MQMHGRELRVGRARKVQDAIHDLVEKLDLLSHQSRVLGAWILGGADSSG
jgi:hypothetical protein